MQTLTEKFGISANEITLVRSSWGLAITRGDKAGEMFYSRLFEVAPQVRPLFKDDMKEQVRKLTMTITLVMTKLDKLDEIMDEIAGLAKRHVKYGTKDEHYAVVRETLVWALSHILENKWSQEMEQAWEKVLLLISAAMIDASKEAA